VTGESKKSSGNKMGRLPLFYRLIIRPLLREPLRTFLTVLAVALGVAVVLAIQLAGNAAAGSFKSSVETLMGDSDLEVTSAGGVPDGIVGTLATLPYAIRVRPRISDFVTVVETGQAVPLIGIDLIAESTDQPFVQQTNESASNDANGTGNVLDHYRSSANLDGVWIGVSLHKKKGDTIRLQMNDHTGEYVVRGVFDDRSEGESLIVMDIAAAQRELGRKTRVDSVLLKVPDVPSISQWQIRLRAALPSGVEVRPIGSRTAETQKMLAAFRWNLRVLSYIALVVGAFLIYNTISVSVVRRRPEIGIVRALGASRSIVLAAFLGEAGCFGLAGALLGCVLGRVLASAALQLLSATVEALYVSSTPARIALGLDSLLYALIIGIGVTCVAAISPAREAASVSPVEAMARGRREYSARVNKFRDALVALGIGACGLAAGTLPAIAGKPLFGYLSAILLIIATAFAIPAVADALLRFFAPPLRKLIGVEGLLGSRSLSGSLRRTSVLIGALATAIGMMTSIGIMVGSFRQTVMIWMDDQLQADLYLRPAGTIASDQHPTMSNDIAEKLGRVAGVSAVDRFRAYDISYDGFPATLGAADFHAVRGFRQSAFVSGRRASDVYGELQQQDAVVVSEPFANKHHLKIGQTISLPLGDQSVTFRIIDIAFDYSSEAGFVAMDRATLLRYLPDPDPSNVALYLSPGADLETVRADVEKTVAGRNVMIFTNRSLRAQAIQIFDRTFVITYALEAISIVVAVIGIAGALLALVVDRRREFGLLRFLGAATLQIRKLILVEAGLIGLIASFVGLLLGLVLSVILIYVINKQSFGWTIQFHWPVAVLAGSLLGVFLATLLAGLYPARTAVRLNPIEVVHEE
jgi:putative ABC transport system permease protein